jgi:hypothetical protein
MRPLAIIGAALVVLAIGGAAGWVVQGWRKDAEIAAIRKKQADQRADQAEAALADLTAAAGRIRAAADQYAAIQSGLGLKLDQLRKDFQNAKTLPVDCRPDDFRVRHLEAAIDAANAAAAR